MAEWLCGAAGKACTTSVQEDEIALVRVPAGVLCSSRNILEQDIRTNRSKSTQPFIPPGSINRVPASTLVMAVTSTLPGGRQNCDARALVAVICRSRTAVHALAQTFNVQRLV